MLLPFGDLIDSAARGPRRCKEIKSLFEQSSHHPTTPPTNQSRH
jgi:hypothetical protein